ncbi:MAG TPA: Gfo/Idh/MocA family oxidoreductase [Magnetospirillum sp.]|nr:Gfo/Idh/MocA family oxidoreductase [Magnetospirillum sp.]
MSGNLTPVWIIGAGRMAVAYAKVLQGLGRDMRVVGRGEGSAAKFTEQTGLPCFPGGIEASLTAVGAAPAEAIVAVNVEELAATAIRLMEAGTRRILIEKPAGVTVDDVTKVAETAKSLGAEVFVAYNRRFYAAVDALRQAVAEDGGVTFFSFEFTEVSDVIAGSGFKPEVKANWLYANSTHVIDLAFFLGGEPEVLDAQIAGSLAWHPSAARFAGSGRTANGALFSYLADWDAPGRWGVEVMTRARRLVLRPMEQLQVQKRGAFTLEPVAIDDSLDREYKPGLYRQTEAFLKAGPDDRLLPIAEHLRRMRSIFEPMYLGKRQ